MTISVTQDAPVFAVPPGYRNRLKKKNRQTPTRSWLPRCCALWESLTVPAWAMAKITPKRWKISPSSFTTPFRERKSADCSILPGPCGPGRRNRGGHHPLYGADRGAAPGPYPGTGADRRNRRLSGGGRICGIQRTGRRRFDDYRAHGGKGNSQDVADFIEREFLSEEPEPASLEIAKEFINDFLRGRVWQPSRFSDLEKVGIAYTTVTDEEIPSRSMPIWFITALSVIWTGSFWSAGSMRAWMKLIQNELAELDFDDLVPFPMRSWNPSVPRRSRIRMTTAYSAA